MIRFEDITHQVVWMRREAIAAITPPIVPASLVPPSAASRRLLAWLAVWSAVARSED